MECSFGTVNRQEKDQNEQNGDDTKASYLGTDSQQAPTLLAGAGPKECLYLFEVH